MHAGAAADAAGRALPLQVVKLKAFSRFDNTTDALAAATALVDSKLSKGGLGGQARPQCAAGPAPARRLTSVGSCPRAAGLKKFLKKHVDAEENLAVLDKKLGGIVQEKLGLKVLYE